MSYQVTDLAGNTDTRQYSTRDAQLTRQQRDHARRAVAARARDANDLALLLDILGLLHDEQQPRDDRRDDYGHPRKKTRS